MTILFYISGFIAIVATMCVIFNKNPIYALLCLIVSLLSISSCFFVLKAPFAAAIEVIIYTGAIMVLFVFTIMMLDIKSIDLHSNGDREFQYFSFKIFFGILLLISSLLIILLYGILGLSDCFINIFNPMISLKRIGIILFGPYMLVVELASFLLLSALISVLHIAQDYHLSTNRRNVQQSQEYK